MASGKDSLAQLVNLMIERSSELPPRQSNIAFIKYYVRSTVASSSSVTNKVLSKIAYVIYEKAVMILA